MSFVEGVFGPGVSQPLVEEALRAAGLGGVSARVEALQGDGSQRAFYRLYHPGRAAETSILLLNPGRDEAAEKENLAYLQIGRHLASVGVPVPRILASGLPGGWFLLEDLGGVHLEDRAKAAQPPLPLYVRVLDTLLAMQLGGRKGFDTDWCCQTRAYDASVALDRECRYFEEAFLRLYLGLEPNKGAFEEAFSFLVLRAFDTECAFFLHRDFQSRNLMVQGETIRVIDWQGGRLGPLGYDLASLLIDPYVALSDDERHALLARYLERLAARDPAAAGGLQRTYPYLAILRNLQILGAFGFLTRRMGRPHFERHIPAALRSLLQALGESRDPPLLVMRERLVALLPGSFGR